METESQPTILCVDDEPQVLSGLSLHLKRHYRVLTAGSGAEGIRLLRAHPEIEAVMSDMRMPGMDGATFLHAARSILPDAPRLLLTGHADLDSAIAAVNEGQIFRFLVKPCPPPQILIAIDAAVRQGRLITAERDLLQRTLTGAIRALSDVLALTAPEAFGSSVRIKRMASEISGRLLPDYRWAIEIGAMMMPLGAIALPVEVAEKQRKRQPLSPEEQSMVSRQQVLGESLLANIPRLEATRAMLALASGQSIPSSCALPSDELEAVKRGAAILRVAADFDELESEGVLRNTIVARLRARPGRYDPEVLDVLLELEDAHEDTEQLQEIPISALQPGMVIAVDVKQSNGVLLVSRGFEVTVGLIERIYNMRQSPMGLNIRTVVVRTPNKKPATPPKPVSPPAA